MRLAQRLARALGWELVPRRKPRDVEAQYVRALERFGVEVVLDVGANLGQHGALLREQGWRGPILSFEPIPRVHAALVRRAASDPLWEVAPAMALGDRDGTVTLEVSAESDMSSTLPQGPLLRRVSPGSRVVERIEVPLRRLDGLGLVTARPWRRLFLKVDVQGAEAAVLAGAAGLEARLVGLRLELPLVPLYEGEAGWRNTLDALGGRGFAPYLFLPGYFERKLARQLQVDVVLFRDEGSPDG